MTDTTDLEIQLDRLRRERDAVTQELNQDRNRANALERELSYRVADINRLRQQVERLQAELAKVKREA
jgi:ubiquinone biosynthesis protein UbiJ